MSHGRFTIPSEANFAKESNELIQRWGADAIRNSDGTQLDDDAIALGLKVYAAYFPTRGHNEFISKRMEDVPQVFLQSERILAESEDLDIAIAETYFDEQIKPNRDADPHKYWEVIDRTANEVVPTEQWELDAESDVVHIHGATPMHEYTVNFLGYIIWDPVEMYNHITNDWGDKEHEIQFDVRNPEVRDFVYETLRTWLGENPHVDVVRFTTFFYQFTLIFNHQRLEKIVDWMGYAVTVSPRALEDFAEKYGYRMRSEDFVDAGSYGSSFVRPTKQQRDWMQFTQDFVQETMGQLIEDTHAAGKEAMMFLGDQWIGTEPYSAGFAELGLDAVVGSIGDGTTTRMIADIPGVKYHEGRFLPYFFPDSFYEGADPSIEAWDNWRKARRAILRSPIERMGYGGYLSLAYKFPKFVDAVEHIANEFREIYDRTQGHGADTHLTVALLDTWGALRSWQEFTIAHALPYKYSRGFYGLLESLSGMRVDVRFISFDDVLEHGIDPEIDVIINAGPRGTSFSGGDAWKDPKLVATLRAWVRSGKGFVGVGEPSAEEFGGRMFQLADVLGVDQENYRTLNVDKYFPETTTEHFITRENDVETTDFAEPVTNTYPISLETTVLSARDGQIQLATNAYGEGRGVYLSGLPYSAANARLLERILFYAAGKEAEYEKWACSNPECEVAVYADRGVFAVVNNSIDPQRTTVALPDGTTHEFDLAGSGIEWSRIAE